MMSSARVLSLASSASSTRCVSHAFRFRLSHLGRRPLDVLGRTWSLRLWTHFDALGRWTFSVRFGRSWTKLGGGRSTFDVGLWSTSSNTCSARLFTAIRIYSGGLNKWGCEDYRPSHPFISPLFIQMLLSFIILSIFIHFCVLKTEARCTCTALVAGAGGSVNLRQAGWRICHWRGKDPPVPTPSTKVGAGQLLEKLAVGASYWRSCPKAPTSSLSLQGESRAKLHLSPYRLRALLGY